MQNYRDAYRDSMHALIGLAVWVLIPYGRYTWHLDSRGGTTDYAGTDCRAWFDYFKAPVIVSTQRKLLTANVGWWGFLYHSLSSYGLWPRLIP
jgi:hypothetical protein